MIACPSGDKGQGLDLAVQHLLIKTTDSELCEVRRRAVVLYGGFVAVLLVDDNRIGLPINKMRNIADAAWLEARFARNLAQNVLDIVVVFGQKTHANGKTNHRDTHYINGR